MLINIILTANNGERGILLTCPRRPFKSQNWGLRTCFLRQRRVSAQHELDRETHQWTHTGGKFRRRRPKGEVVTFSGRMWKCVYISGHAAKVRGSSRSVRPWPPSPRLSLYRQFIKLASSSPPPGGHSVFGWKHDAFITVLYRLNGEMSYHGGVHTHGNA